MKKLMLTAIILLALGFAPKSRAGVSFGISIGDGYSYPPAPRYEVVTPYCPPPPAPVYVVPRTYCETPRYDYRRSYHHDERRGREFHRLHR